MQPSTDTAAVTEPKVQGSCNDLEFAFLHATCSKKHKKRAWFKQHRVATFLVGRPDAITSSVKLPAQRAAVRQEIAPDSDRRGKSEEQKTACTQSWPYYDRTCMPKQTGGNARVVRVIALTAKLQSGECKGSYFGSTRLALIDGGPARPRPPPPQRPTWLPGSRSGEFRPLVERAPSHGSFCRC